MRGQKNMVRLAITGLISGLLLGAMHVMPTSAATASGKESITLSPVSKHYKFDPGVSKTDEVTVVNDGEKDYTFTVYAKPYSVKNEAYEPDFFTVKSNTDIESWITFEKTSFVLKAGETKTVPYTVSVPASANPGGHYAVIFAETQPAGILQGTSVERKKRVGALVYATVSGDYKTGGAFQGVRTPPLQFVAPLKSELDIENTGNTDFVVDTVFAVSDIFGNRKYTETKQYQMLPQTKRKLELKWTASPGFGLYRVTTSAKLLDKETSKTALVLMAPILFYMVFVIGLLGLVIYYVQKLR